MTIEADPVILAIGQASKTAFCRDFCFLEGRGDLPVQKGLIANEAETQQTGMRGVFAGGGAANGPATVVQAIAAVRRAAASIDQYLGGDGVIACGIRNTEGGMQKGEGGQVYDGKRKHGFAELLRAVTPSLPPAGRRAGFDEVELGSDEDQISTEVHRCLQCDLEIGLNREKGQAEMRNSFGAG